MEKFHDKRGHISSERVILEIKKHKFYWKTIRNDVKKYIKNCAQCMRNKIGVSIKITPIKIITKGPCERFVIDGWRLPKHLAEITGYEWVIDIIDHFTKYLWSYPVKDNNAQNALYCIKNFCMMVGYPKILQSDNDSEYKNNIIKNFCIKNNIKQIFIAPRHPETNGVIEVSHKEIRKNVIINYSHNPYNFDLNNAVLDAIENHNQNIHTLTHYRPIDLLKNTDEDIYNEVITNIGKINYTKKDNNVDNINVGIMF